MDEYCCLDTNDGEVNSVIQNYKSVLKKIRQNKPRVKPFIRQVVNEHEDESQISSASQFLSIQNPQSLMFYSITGSIEDAPSIMHGAPPYDTNTNENINR